jgi:hypothetical protein
VIDFVMLLKFEPEIVRLVRFPREPLEYVYLVAPTKAP